MTNVVLQSLIRKEGYLIVVDYGSRPEAEGDGARQSSSKDDRILAVAPNYVRQLMVAQSWNARYGTQHAQPRRDVSTDQ
ncbi:hypothetical protein NC653_009348 [Populus alba x Populus x berolinensis]|uniref:Uncharacterized protein n=1 Tax=Populus alba x Populus x berolinensis TaxID=444605 RepID=A0AAD6R8Y9_9ROSI|nr:hypothetical protein NC653_009348 [Populus alba x Populus x berolinensis]